ncbi:MAG: fluoride efflux transporter FluC [Candidatus Nanopelagicaceae bacterium]
MVHFKDLQEGHLLKRVALVFLGGAIGSTSRWLIGELIANGVLVVLMVNVLGTALAGYIGFNASRSEFARLFWITGFAGGFTTFSSLAYFMTELPLVESALLAGITLILSLSILAAMAKKS